MTPWLAPVLFNHLWESTLFAVVVWLGTLALRRNGARVRYWLWTAASLKFLTPFAVLVHLGRQFDWRSASDVVPPAASFVVEQVLVAPAFSGAAALEVQTPAAATQWLFMSIWLAGVAGVLASWWRQWLPLRAALRRCTVLELDPEYGSGNLC